MAAELLELPEIKSTVAFFKKRIDMLANRKGISPYLQKLQMTPLVVDYKRLEMLVRELFNVYGLSISEPTNLQHESNVERVIEQLNDHVQHCLVRYKIEVVSEDAN